MPMGSRDKEEQKMAIARARRKSGLKFITLALLNIKMNGIQGFDITTEKPFLKNGLWDCDFNITEGPMNFVPDQKEGEYLFELVDTERNRIALAAHLDNDGNETIFEVYGPRREEIMADLMKIYRGEKRHAVGLPAQRPEEMSSDQLEAEIARLAKLQDRRKKMETDVQMAAAIGGGESEAGLPPAPADQPATTDKPADQSTTEAEAGAQEQRPMTQVEKMNAGKARRKLEREAAVLS